VLELDTSNPLETSVIKQVFYDNKIYNESKDIS